MPANGAGWAFDNAMCSVCVIYRLQIPATRIPLQSPATRIPNKHKHKLVGRMLPWGLFGLTAVQYSLSYSDYRLQIGPTKGGPGRSHLGSMGRKTSTILSRSK
jgi:hypothetical protein